MEILTITAGVLLFLWAMLTWNSGNTPVPKRPHIIEIDEYSRKIIQEGLQYVEEARAIIVAKEVPAVTMDKGPVQHDDMPRLKNIASNVPNPLEWFVCDRKDLPGPSPAEALIIEALNRYKVKWYREVSVTGLQVNTYSYPRYDIMIIVPNTAGIHIIEYDSKLYHSNPQQIAMDRLKDQFCHKHHIPITRWNSKHYYKLHEEVAILMKQYKIPPKVR